VQGLRVSVVLWVMVEDLRLHKLSDRLFAAVDVRDKI